MAHDQHLTAYLTTEESHEVSKAFAEKEPRTGLVLEITK